MNSQIVTKSLRLYNVTTMTVQAISHDRQDETIEAKALWFQSLSLAERMELLCAFTELILATNPKIVEKYDAQPAARRVRILSAA